MYLRGDIEKWKKYVLFVISYLKQIIIIKSIANMNEKIQIPSEFTLINSAVVTNSELYDIIYNVK